MDYHDISVDLSTRRVRFKGPPAFMEALDWDEVEAEALSLCPTMPPAEAVREAIWRQYATWWEREYRGKGFTGRSTGGGLLPQG
jgi:hypothetical protein